MTDTRKYLNMSDHDLLVGLSISSDAQTKHLEKINGRLDDNDKEHTRLKIIVAVILAGGGAGAARILNLIGG